MSTVNMPENCASELINTNHFWEMRDEKAQATLKSRLLSLACNGSVSEFKELLSKSNDINLDIEDESGWSLLIHAAFKGYYEIVKNIVEHQKNLIIKQSNHNNNDKNKGEKLKKNNDTTMTAEQQKKFSLFIQKRVTWNGSTALHLAVSRGHKDIAEYLIKECNSDINEKDYDLATPLHCAVLGKHLNIIQMLLEYGANTNIRDIQAKTVIDWAKERKQTECLNLFAKHKKSNIKNKPDKKENNDKNENMCYNHSQNININDVVNNPDTQEIINDHGCNNNSNQVNNYYDLDERKCLEYNDNGYNYYNTNNQNMNNQNNNLIHQQQPCGNSYYNNGNNEYAMDVTTYYNYAQYNNNPGNMYPMQPLPTLQQSQQPQPLPLQQSPYYYHHHQPQGNDLYTNPISTANAPINTIPTYYDHSNNTLPTNNNSNLSLNHPNGTLEPIQPQPTYNPNYNYNHNNDMYYNANNINHNNPYNYNKYYNKHGRNNKKSNNFRKSQSQKAAKSVTEKSLNKDNSNHNINNNKKYQTESLSNHSNDDKHHNNNINIKLKQEKNKNDNESSNEKKKEAQNDSDNAVNMDALIFQNKYYKSRLEIMKKDLKDLNEKKKKQLKDTVRKLTAKEDKLLQELENKQSIIHELKHEIREMKIYLGNLPPRFRKNWNNNNNDCNQRTNQRYISDENYINHKNGNHKNINHNNGSYASLVANSNKNNINHKNRALNLSKNIGNMSISLDSDNHNNNGNKNNHQNHNNKIQENEIGGWKTILTPKMCFNPHNKENDTLKEPGNVSENCFETHDKNGKDNVMREQFLRYCKQNSNSHRNQFFLQNDFKWKPKK